MIRTIAASALCMMLLIGCASIPTPPPVPEQAALVSFDVTARRIAADAGLVVTGMAESTTVVLPDSFDEWPWEAYQSAAASEKRDLSPYAGQSAILTSYQLEPDSSGAAQTYTVVRQGDQILGAWVSVDGELGGPHGLGISWDE